MTLSVNLTAFTPGSSAAWAGYTLELQYDPAILRVDSVTRGMCAPATDWDFRIFTGDVATGCFDQNTSTVGTLDTVAATCIAAGTSTIHIVPYLAPERQLSGTQLFDQTGDGQFALSFVDATVTCAPVRAVGGIAHAIKPATLPAWHSSQPRHWLLALAASAIAITVLCVVVLWRRTPAD